MEAISSPLLETSIKGAKGILISMSVSPDVSLDDVDLASALITKEANSDANVIWGVAFDPTLEDEMRVTIIATGFEKKPEDAMRTFNKVKTNPESPFRKEAAAPAARPAQPSGPAAAAAAPKRPVPGTPNAPKAPAGASAPPVKKPAAAPVRRPAPKPADDEVDIWKW